MAIEISTVQPARLKRRLGLPLLVLYGTGITIGAGIYVLIGAVAGHAGVYAPWSFMLAAVVMAFTVASYIELSTRYPVSAGEAAYIRAAFQSRILLDVDRTIDGCHCDHFVGGRCAGISRIYSAICRSPANPHCHNSGRRARRRGCLGNFGIGNHRERIYAD